MLKILKRIVQEVTTAGRLEEALSTLSLRIKEALAVDAVCVYLIDDKREESVLVAQSDLNTDQYITRLPSQESLIGMVGKREEPINIDNMLTHPIFLKTPHLKDRRFHSFLGVPIIQHRKLYGVLTAQQIEQRYFDDAEEAFLITLTAQLGGIIAHAETTGELSQLTNPVVSTESPFTYASTMRSGIGAVSGVAIGQAVVVYPPLDIESFPKQLIQDIQYELDSIRSAIHATRQSLYKLSQRMQSSVSDAEHALFDVYFHMLEDRHFIEDIEQLITEQQLSAKYALSLVIKQHLLHFNAMTDPYLRERSSDLKDIGQRILSALHSSDIENIEYPKHTILIGEEINASHLLEVPEGQLSGIISAKGATHSHVAILARALGVPTIVGAKGLILEQIEGQTVIVDGYNGNLFISPSKTLLNEYKILAEEERELNTTLITLRDKPAKTTDNHRISLQVNTGLAVDAGLSMSVGAEGVGLYRSEIPFMNRDCFPSEDEQYIIYRQILQAFAPQMVTMRTLDIGGDKLLPYFPIEDENPYLGWRGIRVTLDHPEVFLIQIRAMMRANKGLHNLRILLPMITTLTEVDEALYLIDQAYHELVEDQQIIQKPDIGVMIEVPAAVFQAKELAKKVHFLSIGTNDLIQYLLAVDRNNARVSALYDPLHPAILKTLMKVVEGGHAAGVEVSVCGEMASDPYAVILLLAMGFDMLSMNSTSLPRVKWIIRSFSIANARKILADVLMLEHASDIRLHLQRALEKEGLGGLIRAGKS